MNKNKANKKETMREYIDKMRKSYIKFNLEEILQFKVLIFSLECSEKERKTLWKKITNIR